MADASGALELSSKNVEGHQSLKKACNGFCDFKFNCWVILWNLMILNWNWMKFDTFGLKLNQFSRNLMIFELKLNEIWFFWVEIESIFTKLDTFKAFHLPTKSSRTPDTTSNLSNLHKSPPQIKKRNDTFSRLCADAAKKLEEQCFYDQTCLHTDENSICLQINHNAICACKDGFHVVTHSKPTRRTFCTQGKH